MTEDRFTTLLWQWYLDSSVSKHCFISSAGNFFNSQPSESCHYFDSPCLRHILRPVSCFLLCITFFSVPRMFVVLSSKINDKRGEEKERQRDIETRDVKLRLKEHVRELHRIRKPTDISAQVQRRIDQGTNPFCERVLMQVWKQDANRKEVYMQSSGFSTRCRISVGPVHATKKGKKERKVE